MTLGAGPGDEVIGDYTFSRKLATLSAHRALPVFADVRPGYLDRRSATQVLVNERTVGIAAVDLAGSRRTTTSFTPAGRQATDYGSWRTLLPLGPPTADALRAALRCRRLQLPRARASPGKGGA